MKLFALLLILCIFFCLGWLVYNYYQPFPVKETILEIKKGSSAADISELLEAKGIIKNRLLFNIYIRLNAVDHQLSYGRYLFEGEMTLADVIKVLTSAKVMLKKLTIPEGLTMQQTAQLLSAGGFGEYNNYISLFADSTFASSLLGIPVQSLEGFLFPETYKLPDQASEEYIVKLLVREFHRQTQGFDFTSNGLSLTENIALASIVEKEAHYRDEYPHIAGVYLNRLSDNHKLQADPTVAYVLAKRGITRRNGKIYYKDLRIDSPYNTYKYTGLPPGPICSPGISAIDAVLYPKETDDYFFFANNNGRHEFSRTYREHLRKQNEMKNSDASR